MNLREMNYLRHMDFTLQEVTEGQNIIYCADDALAEARTILELYKDITIERW